MFLTQRQKNYVHAYNCHCTKLMWSANSRHFLRSTKHNPVTPTNSIRRITSDPATRSFDDSNVTHMHYL